MVFFLCLSLCDDFRARCAQVEACRLLLESGEAALPLSLDAFSQRYTSEDNASFEAAFERARREHVRQHWWAYDARALLDAGLDARSDASRVCAPKPPPNSATPTSNKPTLSKLHLFFESRVSFEISCLFFSSFLTRRKL